MRTTSTTMNTNDCWICGKPAKYQCPQCTGKYCADHVSKLDSIHIYCIQPGCDEGGTVFELDDEVG